MRTLMSTLMRLFAVLLTLWAGTAARAQLSTKLPSGDGIPNNMTYCLNSSSVAVPCPAGSSAPGGATGGAITAAAGAYSAGALVDGAIVSLGTEADAPWAGSGSATLIAINKASSAALAAIAAATRINDAATNRLQTHDDYMAAAFRTNDAATNRLQTHDDYMASVVRLNDAGTTRLQSHDDTLAAVLSAGALLVSPGTGMPTATFMTRVQGPNTPAAAPSWGNLSECSYSSTPPTLANGYAAPCQADATGKPAAAASATATPFGASTTRAINASASAMPTLIKASSGQVYGYTVCNTTTGTVYFRLFNLASAPTVGTSTPALSEVIATGQCARTRDDIGVVYSTGISLDVTTGSLADSDATTITTANQVVATVFYK